MTAILSGVLGATLGDRLAVSAPEIPEAQRVVVAQAIANSPADPGGNSVFATLPRSSLAGVQDATESSLALGVRIAALAAAVPIAGAWSWPAGCRRRAWPRPLGVLPRPVGRQWISIRQIRWPGRTGETGVPRRAAAR